MTETWPNFFIVGAQKAGTSSLYGYLDDIPGIYMSPEKEPNFFHQDKIENISEKQYFKNKKNYLKLFSNVKNEKVIGEASPTYLSDPISPVLIHQFVPEPKILITLRDPVERLFSFHLMMFRLGETKLNFHDELLNSMLHSENISNKKKDGLEGRLRTGLENGLYFEDVKRFQNIFGKKNVKIIIFEEFIKKPKEIIEEILKFLNVDYNLDNFNSIVYNAFAVSRGKPSQSILTSTNVKKISKYFPKSARRIFRDKILLKQQPKPKISEEDRITLKKFYKNDVDKLFTLLERKLLWKNFIDTNDDSKS